VRAVVAAFAFLTRLPLWAGPMRDVDLGRSVSFFPIVGLVLGLVLTVLGFALSGTFAPGLTAVILVALLGGLTGGLHLDGLADLFDGVGGGRGDRARTLEIMRDSRVGAHGAAALVLLLLAKVLALAQVLGRGDLMTVLMFPAVARWAVTPAIAFVPYARPEGLGRAFSGEAGLWQVLAATIVTAAVLAALGLRRLVPAAAAALLVVAGLSLWVRRRIGGLTGDAYGAAIELAEVTVLLIAGAGRAT
jgi:adenosylcobinamide-GDP ribazoletransferase